MLQLSIKQFTGEQLSIKFGVGAIIADGDRGRQC